MNTGTGAPVPFARVVLQPKGGETLTDSAGAFQFARLEPGDYMVTAFKTGFTAADDHEGGDEVQLTASREKYALLLAPLSSIRGRITDSEGEPVEGVTVVALRSIIETGRRQNQIVTAVETNDRGEYRVPLLLAGRYLVKANGQFSQTPYYGDNPPPAGARESFAPVYFGGSRDVAGATVLPLQPGSEVRADFSLTLQPGHSIRGRISNLRPHASADLQLSSGDEDLGISSSYLELATGEFRIQGVMDGAYRLRAYQPNDGGQLLFAEQNVVLNGHDLEGISLTLRAAPAIKGKLRVEGKRDNPGPLFSVTLEPQDGFLALRSEQQRPNSNWVKGDTFEIPSVFPGKYWVDFGTGYDVYVSSAWAGDTDLLATRELVAASAAPMEMDVVLRTDTGSVSGTFAAETAGNSSLVVLLVPESCNRPATVVGAQPGTGFFFSGVAPGAYRVHAWKASAQVEFASPDVLCALARSGTQMEVRPGAVTKVQLQKLSEEPQ